MTHFSPHSKSALPAPPKAKGLKLFSAAAIACLVLACLVLLIVLLTGCQRPARHTDSSESKVTGDAVLIPSNSTQLAALTIEAVASQHPARVMIPGRLIWDEDATVRVFSPFAGRVQKIDAQLNQPVGRGTALAEILSPDYGSALAEGRKAEIDFRRAERALTRTRELAEHGAAPRKDLESAEADFESARAEKERTEARLSIYATTQKSDGSGFLLPSPLEGIVVEKNVTPGQEVRPDQMLANLPQFTAPLFVVTDPSRLWIQIDATEADLPELQSGSQFTFTSRAFGGRSFSGKVETVSEFLDPNTRTVKVRGSVDNTERLLKAEMFVTVSIAPRSEPAASVPAKAVFLKGDKHYVFLEEHPGEFARHEVSIGSESEGHIPVLAGLESGQRVVTDGCLLLEQLLK
jgi:membrane fusion protein, heavy metal efflux system